MVVLFFWWTGVDSNHRKRSWQIYSLLPLATREPVHISPSDAAGAFLRLRTSVIEGKSALLGAEDGSRTRNLLITNQLLCH